MEIPEVSALVGSFLSGLLALAWWTVRGAASYLRPMISDLYGLLKNFIVSTQELQGAIKTTIDEHDTRKFRKLDEIHADVKEVKIGVDGLHQKIGNGP